MTTRILTHLVGALLLLGCGAPSNFDLCHATCEQLRRCGVSSDTDAANCHTSCDNNKGSLMDKDARDDRECRNAGARRQQAMGCLNTDCNKVIMCSGQIEGCIKP